MKSKRLLSVRTQVNKSGKRFCKKCAKRISIGTIYFCTTKLRKPTQICKMCFNV